MAIPPIASLNGQKLRARVFGSTRLVILLALLALLAACLVFTWITGDVVGNLSFLNAKNSRMTGKKALVDVSPWQTAQALAALAYTAEEKEYAQEAERLADHEVDQAFAAALRQATLDAQHLTLAGDALAAAKKVERLGQLIAQDQDDVQTITEALKAPPPKNGKAPEYDEGDLEVAKAQLGLDKDELADAQQDLSRASGDQTSQIQAELNTHEAAMKEYDRQVQRGGSQVAAISERRYGTLAGRIGAWFRLGSRYSLLQEALDHTRGEITNLTAQHNALEAKVNAMESVKTDDLDAKLQAIKMRSGERQILSILDDRIETEQQLATVYAKWSAQVLLQRRIVLHLTLQSLALIAFIGICMVVCDAGVRRIMATRVLDNRRALTLRSILELSIQVIGVVLILLVIFGTPKETPTILGLATAALTIALQDFIIAFLGWFVLIGRNGIHVGDWVEINGVGGEVIDVRLFSTTLLETGTLADKGLPTGRRITFMNGYAIRGQYFNFSTSGQWMWDEITLSLPASDNVHELLERIQKAVEAETGKNASQAEQEWKRGVQGRTLSRFSATAVENLRPSASGIDVLVRYVTRASERFEERNRLYQKLLEVLRQPAAAPEAEAVQVAND